MGLAYVGGFASAIKGYVESGAVEPVEGFAILADLSKSQFNGDIRDLVWAMTLVLDDFDANRGPIWPQATGLMGGAGSNYFVGQDWLSYRNNPDYDKYPWCDPTNANNCVNSKWTHSLRGDWKKNYWDKTANQAYHFWFYAAVAFFDGTDFALIGNAYHDKGEVTSYDFIGSQENEAPPPWNVSSQPDKDLAYQGVALGYTLRNEHLLQSLGCTTIPGYFFLDIGNWIRSHLKG
jgi:hypothetical protein